MGTQNKKAHRIFSVKAVIVPSAVSVAIIMTFINMLAHVDNGLNEKLAQSLKNSAQYVETISDFMGGASLLNETSVEFIVNPVDSNGEVIWGQLRPFAIELSTRNRRADDLLATVSDYEITDATRQHINTACDDARFFLDNQLHAIGLVTSVYPLPDLPLLSPVASIEISQEEQKMPAAARLALAKSLVLSEECGVHRKSLADSVELAIAGIKESSAKEIESTKQKVGVIRWLLWISIIIESFILIIAYGSIYYFLAKPLVKATKHLDRSEKLNENYGLKELRIAAAEYNRLIQRRNQYEAELKTTAETDPLTGLSNRYAYEKAIEKLKKAGPRYPLCIYSFDLDYLKITNDTYGHVQGDKLLETAAVIIKECFGDNCYRIGGDEFIAIIEKFSPGFAMHAEKKFAALLQKENISISFGSSISHDLNEKSFIQMQLEADEMMYKRKHSAQTNDN